MSNTLSNLFRALCRQPGWWYGWALRRAIIGRNFFGQQGDLLLPSPAASTTVYNDTVPMEFARALLSQARAHHHDVPTMLTAARFPFDPLSEDAQTAYVSRQQYSRLCRALFAALDDESGGLMPDGQTPVGTMRLIALSMLNSPDLGAAIRRGIEFNACCRVERGARIIHQLSVDQQRKEASLSYTATDTAAEVQHLVLSNMAIWLRFCGWLIGQHIDITGAHCAGPQPQFMAPIRHFFACPVSFDHPANSLSFSARHLEAEVIRDEAQLTEFLELAPYHLVIEPPASISSITYRIRELLGDDFRLEMPSFEELTELLGMSARTLRRRLEKEGTSYQRIKDNARRDVAIALLSRDGLTVSEVAEQLGFSDPSAFHRSFKKWTGQSPGSYR